MRHVNLRHVRLARTVTGVVIGVGLATALAVAPLARGQAPRPNNTDTAKTNGRYPTTYPVPQYALPLPANLSFRASEAVHDIWFSRSDAITRVQPEAPSMATDSLRAAIEARGKAWLEQLRANAPDAIHLDDAGRVHVVAGADSTARRLFAQRLAFPKLSVAEQAYTLLAGVSSFADTTHPARLSVAEEYAAALDRLPEQPAGLYLYCAHATLATAYDDLGQRAAALRHATRAIMLLGRIPVTDREEFYNEPKLYLIAAHALQHESDGKRRLDSLAAAVKAATQQFFPGMTRMDSIASAVIVWRQDSIARFLPLGSLIGSTAPALRAHAWWNVPGAPSEPSHDASRATNAALDSGTSLRLNDGTVRLVLFGNIYCCMDAIRAVDRMQGALPEGASVLLATETTGYMNGVLVSPEDESRQLRAIYRDTLHLTLPIALWVGQKHATEAGGSVPTASPNTENYFVSRTRYGGQGDWGAPYVGIVDKHGILRHVFNPLPLTHGFSRDDQQRAIALIRELVTAQ
jgi:hypothetical protein